VPAEIIGTLSAIIFPTIISLFSDNLLLIAFVGTWGENIGFYGVMISQEITQTRRKYKKYNKKYSGKAFTRDIRNIFLEFGLSESLDSLFLRPAMMYMGLSIFKNFQIGILVGKILADTVFYVPAIISYEFKKKYLLDY
jgi:hypothetical protein